MKFMAMLLCAAMVCGLASCNREEDGDLSSGEWVDLGLPSGLLWASCNIGANSPEEFGNNYAWGETQTKENFEPSNYRYGTGEYSITTLTKYNTDPQLGQVDNRTVLEPSDDVAQMVLGGGARIPTKVEWDELLNNTDMEWFIKNNIAGCKIKSRTNGKSIFLPAGGLCGGGAGISGSYWSSSLSTDKPNYAYSFFVISGTYTVRKNDRSYGLTIRAVKQPNDN